MLDTVKEREKYDLDAEIMRLKQFKAQLNENVVKEQAKEKEIIVLREQAEKSLSEIVKKISDISGNIEKLKIEQRSLVDTNTSLKTQTRTINAELENSRTESYKLDDVIKNKRRDAEKTVILDMTALEEEKKRLLIIKGDIEVQKEMLKAQEIKSKEAKLEAEKILVILSEEKNITENKLREYMELKNEIEVKQKELNNSTLSLSSKEANLDKKRVDLQVIITSLDKREKKLVDDEIEIKRKKTALEAEDLRLCKERADIDNIEKIKNLKEKVK